MADGGWIKLYRKTRQSFVWIDPNLLKLWMLLLFKASHDGNKFPFNGHQIVVSSGQLVTGSVALASEFNEGMKPDKQVTSRSVWRWVKRFEKEQMLSIKSGSQYSVITINNWAEYQNTVKQMSSERQADVKQVSTIKNAENAKKESSSHKSANRTYDDQSKELRAATKLWELIQRNNPKAKQQDLQKWADVFRLMHERDNRSWKDIGTLIQWSQNDSFWSSNILSANKLRKQFDQLTAKMNQEGGGFVPEQLPLETPHTFSAVEYAVSAYQTGSSIDEIIEMAKDEGAPATPDEIRSAIDAYNKRREEDD